MTTFVTVREALLVAAAFVLLVALIYFWRSYGAPADQAVVTATLAVTVQPATLLPTPAPTMTALVVPERLLLTPTATRVLPLVLPATETPTPIPTATAVPEQSPVQRG